MIAHFLITFRETLEAAIIVGIILSYLRRTGNARYNNVVYIGTGAGLVASIIFAIVFSRIFGGFTGRPEEIFEGIAMLAGAILISSVVLWMMNNKNIVQHIKNKVRTDLKNQDRAGLFMLVFISVLREGVETVLFLGTASLVSPGDQLIGGIIGVLIALALGYAIFVMSLRIEIKRFFLYSSILLLLFAAGLVAHGVHELQEAQVIPVFIEHLYDINPKAPYSGQGVYPVLHEKGALGSIAKSLFGFNGDPSLMEVLSYLVYLSMTILIYRIRIASARL